MGFFVC